MKPLRPNEYLANQIKRNMVEFVNDHFPEFSDSAFLIRKILDDNDVVFGLWQDASEPDGVGMNVIKGKNLIREVVASRKAAKVRIAAVPCKSAEHALATEQVCGDQVN